MFSRDEKRTMWTEKERAASRREGRSGGPASSGDLCPAASSLTGDWNCGGQVAVYLGRLEPTQGY